MHLINSSAVNATAIAVGIANSGSSVSKLAEKWGQGHVEFYCWLAHAADLVTVAEDRLSEALDGAGWPGVFAYEVSEEVGGHIASYMLCGDDVPNDEYLWAAILDCLRDFCRSDMTVYLNLDKTLPSKA